MMDISLDIAALLAAIVWPLVLLAILFKYRVPVGEFLTNLGKNPVESLEVPWVGISLRFAIAKPMMSNQDPFAEVFRQPTPSYEVVSSDARSILAAQLKDDTPAVYAVIDLGEGRSWLTSRLYILALLLHRMRNIQLLVFVETNRETSQHFVGFAETTKVRWALAQRFVRLEEAFSIAYTTIMRGNPQGYLPHTFNEPPRFRIMSREGRLANGPSYSDYTEPSDQILREFLQRIQQQTYPTGAGQDAWVRIPTSGDFEHAQWLDTPFLKELLGKDLVTTYVRSSNFEAKPNSEQVKIILSEPTPYVALTQENGRFEELIERQPLNEKAVQNMLQGQGRVPA
jgi:hypothetical protein